MSKQPNAEQLRLQENAQRSKNWQRWGTYLSERQWGTVREDYSSDGESWYYLPHDQARSRAYRWGEDGLLGLCDRQGRICFGLSLWNERDPILKERLFGLSGPEGNHGEDVKECYYYLDGTPTHSYMQGLYKYPQREFPYRRLVDENRSRSRGEPEFELLDSGIFSEDRYFDVEIEYAKGSPNDLLIQVTIHNRGDQASPLHIIPTVWFRNTWSWQSEREGDWPKPIAWQESPGGPVQLHHVTLDRFFLHADVASSGAKPDWIFTDNETNRERTFGEPNVCPYVKDAFHDYVMDGNKDVCNPDRRGTKAGAYYRLRIGAHRSTTLRLRLFSQKERPVKPFGRGFTAVLAERKQEADEFHAELAQPELGPEQQRVMRQAYAGLLWTKQFYYYVVREWLAGDPTGPAVEERRKVGRNSDWPHLFNRDVISMPDKWEYPWYAAWDLAFHMIPLARVDGEFAKSQLLLFLREWYMHPNGQLPAYEWALSDVNPPVHAWACQRVYQLLAQHGNEDREFLARVFQKLLLNFTWWVNRKDVRDHHLFAGGFLGLDNIGVFDRSKPLPTGGHLEQADGTAWMAFYSACMLSIAVELAGRSAAYDDMASKFFEHFFAIAKTMNAPNGQGLWNEEDGFYYDHLNVDGQPIPLKVRSLVGLIPLITVTVLSEEVLRDLPGFQRRTAWFLEHNAGDVQCMTYLEHDRPDVDRGGLRLLAVPSQDRLMKLLRYLLDEDEFLSPFGIRSLSKYHEQHPFVFQVGDQEYRVAYLPGESDSAMFGGNSNWRGPIWFPLNYLIVEALFKYHEFYGERLQVECPTGSGNLMTLDQVAEELKRRLLRLFLPDSEGRRPTHGTDNCYASDEHWRNLVLYYEYFNAETGKGLGASHQTGWTALAASLMCNDPLPTCPEDNSPPAAHQGEA